MAIALTNTKGESYDGLQLKSSFRKKIRRYFGNFHQERGVFYEHTNDSKYLDDFMAMIHKTESRQNINLRNKAYFQTIMDHFDAHLFFGKLDLETYATFLRNHNKEKNLQEIEEYLLKNEKILTISASLVIIPKNKSGIRTSEYLYTGNDMHFDKLYVSYGLVYNIAEFSIEQKCQFLNLGGVDGSLKDHLSMFKARFNPVVWEFSGEYDYKLSWLYYPIEKLLPTVKKWHHKIRRK
jgi:lipid II:glycine glycyltransferase (peptidoglycan interpeptide bridge formation enzyme)